MRIDSGKLRVAAFLLPAVALVLVQVWPLLAGTRTLVIRDVLNTHATQRLALVDGLRSGEIPLIDPLRSGGQALAGNANVLAFYPDNVLLLLGSHLWQLNVHFVLHWLVAFATTFWLGRAWGLGRDGAAAAAVTFALSGYWFSQLNFYNAVGPVALSPALWAGLLETGEATTRRRGLLAVGLLWALMILGGDPIVATIALGSGLLLALSRHARALPALRIGLALLLGTLVAAPQIVETLRILPMSFRAVQGYAGAAAGVRDPRAVLDLVLPLFFGRPDLGAIWGRSLFGGHPPIYFSLAPGLLAVALVLGAGVPRRREARLLATLSIAAFVLTFSGGTPLPTWLAAIFDGTAFRFPEKTFLIAALALVLAAGRGFERWLDGAKTGWWWRSLGVLVALTVSAWICFGVTAANGGRLFAVVFPELDAPRLWAEQHVRWAGLAMFTVAQLAAAALVTAVFRHRRVLAMVLILALHAATQLLFLRPLVAVDESAEFTEPPPIAAAVPEGVVLAHGGVTSIFGEDEMAGLDRHFPDRRLLWLQRNAWSEFHAFSALSDGRRLEFALSPEGLDSYVSAMITSGMKTLDDARRVALLRATGVDLLLLARDLEPRDAGGTRLTRTVQGLARMMRFYEIPSPLPEVTLAGSIVRAPHVNAALDAVWRSGFDPATTAVIPGSGPPVVAPSGTARLAVSEREHVEVEIDSPAGGVLILRRAHLPIWRAAIDGVPAPTVIAQLTRLAVEVPPGPHRVVLSISRWPLRISAATALLALAALILLWRWDGRRAAGPVNTTP